MPRATPAINATHVLARLCDQAASDLTLLETSLEDFGEAARQGMDMDEAPVNPIMDKFVNVLGPEGIRSLTNFTVSEIESLWSIVDDALNAAWLEGRGRKSTTSPKNRLFTLTVMKQFCSWDKHAADFSFKAPTFEKMIMRTVTTFTWGEKIYLSLQKTTFALTNFHLLLLPMLAEDENYYAMVLARYQRMASEKKRKRAETQHRYRLRRRSYRHGYQSRSFLAIQWLKYFQCSCILVKTN
ncbi:hypothetical protein DYB25_012605 [Aphanomyces astaci]|uniref:Uncharacterized protein n=3 Tax=Aphanomyces astaci TaxID=112090 RepID=A0A397A5E0_APHAT|nr:hypothetical protein DYB36_012942 [Aphanomyces astaci]RHY26420.1 hypothetical protein DYB25_012605 [Aphanomyces astaci]RHZ17304.1 hypothetical protein DYB31_011048 [Aphanomyces astaci]